MAEQNNTTVLESLNSQLKFAKERVVYLESEIIKTKQKIDAVKESHKVVCSRKGICVNFDADVCTFIPKTYPSESNAEDDRGCSDFEEETMVKCPGIKNWMKIGVKNHFDVKRLWDFLTDFECIRCKHLETEFREDGLYLREITNANKECDFQVRDDL
jgi:hypothetical protein